MDVSGAQGPGPIANLDHSVEVREKLQVALLRKQLEVQQEQAAELLRLADGKGQVLDIRC